MFDDTSPQPAPQQPMSGPTPPPPMQGLAPQATPGAESVPVQTMDLPPLEPPMTPMGKHSGGKGKRVILILVIAIVLVGLGIAAAAYFFPAGTNMNNSNTNTVLNNLNSATVVNTANTNKANANGNTNKANTNAVANTNATTNTNAATNTNTVANTNAATNTNGAPASYAVDTDSDTLNDYLEGWLTTNTRNADSDGDGYQDGNEVVASYSPLGPGTLAATQLEAFCTTSELVLQHSLTASEITTFCGIPGDLLVSIQVMATNAALYENLETKLTTACAAFTKLSATVCENTAKNVLLSYEIAGT